MKNWTWKRAAALGLMLVLMLAMAACGSSDADSGSAADSETSADAQTASDDVLNIGVSIDFTTIDTIVGYSTEMNMIVNAVTEGLFYFDENSEVQPLLVDTWEQTDQTTYVYQIRQDVTFSDGTQLTAEDVVFSLERHLDEDNASQLAWMFENVDTIEQTGDYEVTVTLTQADPTWQYTLATPAGNVISKAYYEEHAEDFGTAEGGIVGSGAYTITEWATEEITLEYNEDYWDAANTSVGYTTVQFTSVTDESVLKTALASGQIDIAWGVSLEAVAELEETDGVNIQLVDALSCYFVSFNTTVDGLDDARVRQAIAYAIDKDSILSDLIGEKYGEVGESQLFSDKITGANADLWGDYFETDETYSYDPQKATELLEEAGYGDGLELTLKYDASDSLYENLSLYIQANLADVGITLIIEGVDSAEIMTLRYGGSETRDYELLITGWGSDYPDPLGTILPMYYSANNAAGGSNWAEYNSSEFDALITSQAQAETEEERVEILQEALDLIAEDLPYAPIYIRYENWAVSEEVEYTFTTMELYNIFIKDIQKAQ